MGYVKKLYLHTKYRGIRYILKRICLFILQYLSIGYIILIHEKNDEKNLPKIEYVDPNRIEYFSTFSQTSFPSKDKFAKRSKFWNSPIVGEFGGPWDMCRHKYDSSPTYQAIYDRIIGNKNWEDTERYQRKILNGEENYAVKSKMRKYDDLIQSIKKNGYKSQSEIPVDDSESFTICECEYPDEPRVAIGRNGEIIRLGGGGHRISIAKLLNIEKIPVIVVARHNKLRDSELN